MVAKITVPNNIKRALNYNEQKLKDGKAECIYANRFLKEASQLHFYEKLSRFEQLIALNKRATTNTVHISLNFGVNEKLEKEKLAEIATVYMQKIGFGEQPYLVYQHNDAAHPHIHIVTTNIQQNGKRISLHNLGRNESTKARKEIEREYKLIIAEDQQKQSDAIGPITVQRASYGRSPLKRSIVNALDAVLPHFKYTSLAELNAVLGLYNILADRGRKDGLVYQKKGLVYRVLDEQGAKIGVPIKASSIYNKPTLDYFENKFRENEPKKQLYKKQLKILLDWILLKPHSSLRSFSRALEKEKIQLVTRQNEQGVVYGLTYIDLNTKCVFNGSEIGKTYSAKAILEKCGETKTIPLPEKEVVKSNAPSQKSSQAFDRSTKSGLQTIVDQIIQPSDDSNYLPYDLKKRKRKGKRHH